MQGRKTVMILNVNITLTFHSIVLIPVFITVIFISIEKFDAVNRIVIV